MRRRWCRCPETQTWGLRHKQWHVFVAGFAVLFFVTLFRQDTRFGAGHRNAEFWQRLTLDGRRRLEEGREIEQLGRYSSIFVGL